MSTTLDALRQSLATHDAALTVFLCECALCGAGAPAGYAPGWVEALHAELEHAAPGPAFVVLFARRLEQDYGACVLPALARVGASAASAGSGVRACDAACIKALLLRLRFAVRVAESKIGNPGAELRIAAAAGEAGSLKRLITYPAVEQAVIARASGHAADFARRHHLPQDVADRLVAAVAGLYRDWLIPFSCDVQVAWLTAHAGRFARPG
jgi:chorismate mutase